MSEYQYYEFLAVDRPLDASAMNRLREMSTRAHITPTSFVNTYHWGDLKGDPRELTERYFDAFLYTANWGSRRLMFRLPSRLLDIGTAQEYCVSDLAVAWTHGKNVIIELQCESEDGGGDWDDEGGEGRLASIIPARAQLAGGDLRLLYLGWLLSAWEGRLADDELEPPVPANLGSLEGPLSSVAEFLKLDPYLLEVAAEASESGQATDISEEDLAAWVSLLAPAEKDSLLLRILSGDDAQLRTELLRRFTDQTASQPSAQPRRTVGELLASAARYELEGERLTAERLHREQQQREQEAAVAREKLLDELAQEGEQVWPRVNSLIDTMKPREYDLAVQLLSNLQALAQREGAPEKFADHVKRLRSQYASRPALLRRFDAAGLSTL
jgi:hypothetical protein